MRKGRLYPPPGSAAGVGQLRVGARWIAAPSRQRGWEGSSISGEPGKIYPSRGSAAAAREKKLRQWRTAGFVVAGWLLLSPVWQVRSAVSL